MFAIRIHSVDTEHPLFLSLPSNSNPSHNLNPNPKFVERRGIIHLFRALIRHPSTSDSSASTSRSTLLFIVAVPNYFSSDDLLRFFGSHVADISEFIIIRNDGMEDRYSVLIRTWNQVTADAFYRSFNGKRFSPPEVEICHILFVLSMEFTELGEIASTSPSDYVELPTCPICLERLDQDTSGIQSTLCDHSFDCSCISKWTYLSCQVCRLCQQPDDRPNCSVCDTSENLWVCIICGFVGCGRYKEGHTFRHWKDTQHCYSLNLETQRVWDYEGDSYVHRLNHSKAGEKSVAVDSHCMSYDGDCGNCGFKFAELEYCAKVRGLAEASKIYPTLHNVLDVDVQNGSVKCPGSLSRNLRRVRQGLDLIRALFEQFLTTYDCSLREAASSAYTQTCAPYHSWAVRAAAAAGMYALPSRDQLLTSLKETDESAEFRMKRYIKAVVPVIQYIDKLYLSRNIKLDW